jgi:hypothetical protein
MDAVAHAKEGLYELGQVDPVRADREFERWMSYYNDQGIVGVGSGFVILRKTDRGTSWFRTDEIPLELTGDCGRAIVSMFEAQDWLDQHPEPGVLLDAQWSRAENVRLQTTSVANALAPLGRERAEAHAGGWVAHQCEQHPR